MKDRVKKALMDNWGEKASSMNCYAEVKFINPNSDWACYVYALDPSDEDTIECLINMFPGIMYKWSLKELMDLYNTDGEKMQIDPEYRRMRVSELFKKLSGGR